MWQKQHRKQEVCTGRDENPATMTFWKTKKKNNFDSELRCNGPRPQVRLVGIRLSTETGYFTLTGNVDNVVLMFIVFIFKNYFFTNLGKQILGM